MLGSSTRLHAVAAALAGATVLAVPIAVAAQPFANEHIRGTIRSYDVSNEEQRLVLRDDRGFIDDVQLGHETRIAPSGIRLAPGMRVAITGYNGGKWFDAVSIEVIGRDEAAAPSEPSYARPDTVANQYAAPAPAYSPAYPPAYPAYAYSYPVYYPYPVYVNAYPAYYPYPVYAYPYRAYPAVRVGVGFGFGWHGGGMRGGWRR